MTAVVLAVLVPAASVWLVMRAGGLCGRPGAAALDVAAAIAGGLGVSAVTTYWLATLGITRGPGFVVLDSLIWVAVGAAAWRWTRTDGGHPSPGTRERVHVNAVLWLTRVVFVVTAALAIAAVVAHYRAAPHGEWDAWAIWNQKARFFFRGGPQWTDVLAIEWSNPSHPLLVSASVARLWAYAGAEPTFVPALLSAMFAAAIVAAVVGALDTRRPLSWMAGAVVMAPPTFTQLAAAQTADLPTGTFVLLSFVMLREALFSTGGGAWLAAAGLFASLAAWTKNEGLVFLIVSGAIAMMVLVRRPRRSTMGLWAIGAAPALLTVVWFKLAVTTAAPLYMREPLTREAVVSRALATDRHRAIGTLVARMGFEWGGRGARSALALTAALALLAATVGRSRVARLAWAIVIPMGMGYYAVYVLTPLDAEWLVATTFDRLTVHVWPVLVLAACSFAAARGSQPQVESEAA